MSALWRRNREPKHEPEFNTGELRYFADKLTGWTVSGSTTCDIPTLLRNAANEIDRLSALDVERATARPEGEERQ